ncbi:hypothetical protein OG933_07775 [Streptomyces sp. NBC_00016]|uniref:hypothetical protein n=1 Tax=Streptomyces sp. NBC_00016 TaxID=2975622 RepID=UPI00325567DF
MPRTQEEKNELLDRDLAQVAKILAGVFVAIAGIGTAFGLSQDALLTAVNNNLGLFVGVAILALIAVGLSLLSLFFKSNGSGNLWQLGFLGAGSTAYLIALLMTVGGVASYATGNGRPNVTNVSVVPGSPVKINFTVHADGMQAKKVLIVVVDAFKDKAPIGTEPLYRTILHADDKGDIEQKVEFVMERGEATRLTIRARPDKVTEDGAVCDSSQDSDKLGCATVILPPEKKKA